MERFIIADTSAAQWYDLICSAEKDSAIKLSQDLESYLVFLLMRFTNKPEMVSSILALRFLDAIASDLQGLQEVGDECLLYAGLFPMRAEHKRVKISYFVRLGQNAYTALANHTTSGNAALYLLLSAHFVGMMDVLQALRPELGISVLHAAELALDVNSQRAISLLQKRYKNSLLIRSDNQGLH